MRYVRFFVPGDIEEDPSIIKELGKAAANYAREIIRNKDVVAITGGSTIKEVVHNFPKVNNLSDVLVVPARGGMGKKVETQANTLAAELAHKLNGSYKMLHIPENISGNALDTLLKEKESYKQLGIRDVQSSLCRSTICLIEYFSISNQWHRICITIFIHSPAFHLYFQLGK